MWHQGNTAPGVFCVFSSRVSYRGTWSKVYKFTWEGASVNQILWISPRTATQHVWDRDKMSTFFLARKAFLKKISTLNTYLFLLCWFTAVKESSGRALIICHLSLKPFLDAGGAGCGTHFAVLKANKSTFNG